MTTRNEIIVEQVGDGQLEQNFFCARLSHFLSLFQTKQGWGIFFLHPFALIGIVKHMEDLCYVFILTLVAKPEDRRKRWNEVEKRWLNERKMRMKMAIKVIKFSSFSSMPEEIEIFFMERKLRDSKTHHSTAVAMQAAAAS